MKYALSNVTNHHRFERIEENRTNQSEEVVEREVIGQLVVGDRIYVENGVLERHCLKETGSFMVDRARGEASVRVTARPIPSKVHDKRSA